MKGPCSLEQIACAIAERILDDWASLSCSGRSGKGNGMLPPSLDVLLAARRSSSDMPVGVVDISATRAFLDGPMILLREEVFCQHDAPQPLNHDNDYNNSNIPIGLRYMDYRDILILYITMDNERKHATIYAYRNAAASELSGHPEATSRRQS